MITALSVLQSDLYIQLHSTSQNDAIFVNDSEIKKVLADRLTDLAMQHGLYIVRDVAFITLVAGQAVYDLPPRHLSTLHVALNGSPLIASSTAELEGRDATFETTPATALKPIARWSQDKEGFNLLRLHPVPAAADAGSKLEVIYAQYPCEIDEGIEGPRFLCDLLELLALGDLYSRESDFAEPEAAKAANALAGLYVEIMDSLYGSAQ